MPPSASSTKSWSGSTPWQAAHGKGGLRSRYHDKTGIARYREWRGVKDTMVDYAAWLNNLLAMGKMVASAPVPILKGFWEYRWMGSYLGTFAFIDRLFEGYREDELKDRPHEYALYRQQPHRKIALVLANDKRLGGGRDSDNIVPMDEVMPPLFMTGFPGLIPIPIQTLPGSSSVTSTNTWSPTTSTWPSPSAWPLTSAPAARRRPASPSTTISPLWAGRFDHQYALQRQRGHLHVPAPPLWSAGFPVTMAMIHNEPGAHPYSTQVPSGMPSPLFRRTTASSTTGRPCLPAPST